MPATKRKKPGDDDNDNASQSTRQAHDSDSDRSQSPPPPAPAQQQKRANAKASGSRSNGTAPSTSSAAGKAREEPIAIDDDSEPAPAIKPSQRPTAHARELERVRRLLRDKDERLQEALASRDTIQKQLEQLLNVRVSDAEQSRDALKLEYEARIQSLERLNNELTSQLARVDKLARGSRNTNLLFITRDAAAEERRAVERELSETKEAVKVKDDAIAELRETVRLTEGELKMERANAGSRMSREPQSQHGTKGPAKEHQGRLVRFYEDLTNLLVTGIRPGDILGEYAFKCVYSPTPSMSLDFSLTTHAPTPNPSPSSSRLSEQPAQQKYIYTPGPAVLREPQTEKHLDVFAKTFQFPVSQLPAFFRKLSERLSGEFDDDDEDDD